jgi:hypothetical protein
MFDNTLTLQGLPACSVTDTDDGRTTRRHNAGGGVFYEIVTSRQETTENKGTITDRYLTQVALIVPDPSTGKPVRATASIVQAYPRSASIGVPQMDALMTALLSFYTGTLAGGILDVVNAKLSRQYDGET